MLARFRGGLVASAAALPRRHLHSAIGQLAPEVQHGLAEGEGALALAFSYKPLTRGAGCGYVFGVNKGKLSDLSARIAPELSQFLAANPIKPKQMKTLLPTAVGRPAVTLVGLPEEDLSRAAADEQTRTAVRHASL